ncbi:hypothetical protein JCM12214_18130 [Geobacillus vulcani]
MPPEVAVGVILVGCCPSGTASNVMVFLAKGDVALAVAIASVSTILAPIVTPLLIWLLASKWVDINMWSLFAVNYHFISAQNTHFFAHSFRKPSPLF